MACASDDEAQRWLGWQERLICPPPHLAAILATPADGLERPDQPTIGTSRHMVAIDPDRLIVAGSVSLEPSSNGIYEVGGWLAPKYRGRGLGRELFAAALALGHEHLGLELLRAGAQDTNTASRRSLEAVGFRPIDDTRPHTLPNGRVIASCWYEHTAPASMCGKAKRR